MYLLVFMTAEAAFVLMAMREYLQAQFGLSDADVATKVEVPSRLTSGTSTV